MAAKRSDWDTGYDLGASRVQELMAYLHAVGVEIGFHPGYHTPGNRSTIRDNLDRYRSKTGLESCGVRQHYLRFAAPYTRRDWEQLRMDYDSTLGYPYQEVFRCGTCHSYRPYDLELDRPLIVVEYPLIVMDRPLMGRADRNLRPNEGLALMNKRITRCKAVEGDFVVLWRPLSLSGPWREAYCRLLRRLVS